MDAFYRLKAAGFEVVPADGVPGLFDVPGLARDVTMGQLEQLAAEHGREWIAPYSGGYMRPQGC